MPDEASLAAYNASYFSSAHGGRPTDKVSVAFHSAINRLRVAHVERYVEAVGLGVSSVLEVGAGGGFFARHWCARHPETSYHAIESDTSLHSNLQDIGVTLHADTHNSLAGEAVDLVVMSHVLEHSTDPRKFLREMTAPLRPGGALFVEVPCRDWEYKSQDEPHLLFFDKTPMARLLDELRFENVELTYHGEEIERLRSPSLATRVLGAVRSRLLARGVIAPFAHAAPGLEVLEDPLQRAAVAPFEAHREQSRPAWWLRAVAQKA